MQQKIDRRAVARQLRKLDERNGLADEGRIERDASLVLEVAVRLLTLEGQEEEPLTPRALRLIEDAIQNFAPMSQELLRAGLNLDDRSESNLAERIRQVADRHGYSEADPLAERERGLYFPLADFVLEQLSLVAAHKTHADMASGLGDQTAARPPHRGALQVLLPRLHTLWRCRRRSQCLPHSQAPGTQGRREYPRRVDLPHCAVEPRPAQLVSDLGGNWIARARPPPQSIDGRDRR